MSVVETANSAQCSEVSWEFICSSILLDRANVSLLTIRTIAKRLLHFVYNISHHFSSYQKIAKWSVDLSSSCSLLPAHIDICLLNSPSLSTVKLTRRSRHEYSLIILTQYMNPWRNDVHTLQLLFIDMLIHVLEHTGVPQFCIWIDTQKATKQQYCNIKEAWIKVMW